MQGMAGLRCECVPCSRSVKPSHRRQLAFDRTDCSWVVPFLYRKGLCSKVQAMERAADCIQARKIVTAGANGSRHIVKVPWKTSRATTLSGGIVAGSRPLLHPHVATLGALASAGAPLRPPAGIGSRPGFVHARGRRLRALARQHTDIGANIMVRRILVIALVSGSLAVSGCHTVRGLGKDLSSAGEVLQTTD
jgi:predicted small secreted protein